MAESSNGAPAPEYEDVSYELVGHVARISLNRPRYRNAQSRRLLEELDAAFARAAEDTAVRVIVVRGEGESFSAGHDLGTPEQVADLEARPYEEGLRGRYKRSWDMNVEFSLRWRNVPKPTIAAVHGHCIFGGWMIASAMDVIFAAEDAQFLASNFQYFSVPWDIGGRKAKELLFEARFISGIDACELGFVNRAIPAAELDAEVMAYAERVAQNDPFQLRMTKLAVNQALDAQGFTTHIRGAHALHMLSAIGEGDPAASLPDRERTRRRPMVQRALDNQRLAEERTGR
ncbi:MAG: enoyl-CoA hydratase-related protein [Dehalococcoidia bacterium]